MKARLDTAKAKYDNARKKLSDALKERSKQVKRAIKELGKLQEERDGREADIQSHAEREITHLREAAADVLRICSDPEEARRYFAVVERAEIEENEFNLNLPRYVDTFEAEPIPDIREALQSLHIASAESSKALHELDYILERLSVR